MTSKKNEEAPRKLADLTAELAALPTLTSRELAQKLTGLTGQPSRTNNREYLMRAIATVLQERAEPHPRDGIARRVAELGDEVPLRWRMKAKPVQIVRLAAAPEPELPPIERDPRLPAPGTTLTRNYKGVAHSVLVGEDTFQYKGRTFRSLSHVARVITGRQWNGFQFFGLSNQAPVEAAS